METSVCRCSHDSALERGRKLAVGPADGEPPRQIPVGGSGAFGVPEDEPSIPRRWEASVLSTERFAPVSGHRVRRSVLCTGRHRGMLGPAAHSFCRGSPLSLGSLRGSTRDPPPLGSHGQLHAGTSRGPPTPRGGTAFLCLKGKQGSFSTEPGVSIRVPPLPSAPGGPACGPAGALGKQFQPLSRRSGIGQAGS